MDHLLSEHASRYLHKRNRNMIVEIPPDEDIPMHDDFAWLTLGQVRRQLGLGNVNMNARTVLACISYAGSGDLSVDGHLDDESQADVIASHRLGRSDDDLAAAMTWLIDQKGDLPAGRAPDRPSGDG